MMRTPLFFVALLAGCAGSGLQTDGVDFARSDVLFASDSDEAMKAAEALAYAHLEADVARLDGVEELVTRVVQIDDLATAHVRIRQTHHGVPIFGAETIVHLEPAGDLRAITDRFVRHPTITDMQPLYSANEALDLAANATGGWDDVTNLPDAELMVLRHEGEDHLVFMVDLQHLDGTERTSMPRVFVSAKTGEVVWQYDNLQTIDGSANTTYNGAITFPVTSTSGGYQLRGEGVGTYTFNNTEPFWSSINASHLQAVSSSNTTFNADKVATDAHFGMHRTKAYFAAKHNRNGINGFGGPTLKDSTITGGVHYGSSYNNAFWNGTAMVFGDGDGSTFRPLTSLDIAAHEMTHGVTQYTAGLVYQGESGALNESMSDVFGALVEHWVEGDSDDVWKIGEDCYSTWSATDALRYMDNPSLDGSSRDHYSTRYTGTADNGGVHWNSGISNLAFVLVVDGGSHPKSWHSVTTVQGIGFEAAGRIWYRALDTYLTSSSNFAAARTATLQAAQDLYGADSNEVIAVANAWAEVGVGSPMANPDPGPGTDPTTDPVEPPEPTDTLAAATGEQLAFTVTVPEGATELRVTIQGGTGDADLYLRAGAAPTTSAYDCRPYRSGNDEECVIANPAAGTWHIGVRAYAAFAGVTLNTDVTAPDPEPEPSVEFLEELGLAGAKNSEQRFSVDVPAGASNLVFSTAGGTGDADLYVRFGNEPTTTTYDCRPYRSGNAETCTIAVPQAGTYHVMVRAYAAYSGLDLVGTWE